MAEEEQQLREKFYNATLISVHQPHEELRLMRVRPDYTLQQHQPGQYTTLGLGNWEPRVAGCQEEHLSPKEEQRLVRRAYSISSSVIDDSGQLIDLEQTDWLEFYIVLVRESDKEKPPALTPRLFHLQEGDKLFLGEKITGHFTLEGVQSNDTVLFLSTGTGEAPHNYMLWQLLREKHQGPILSACCVRYRQDLGYLSIHQQLQEQYNNYTYVPLTTREKDTIDKKVYIQDLISSGQLEEQLGQSLDPKSTHVFLCGNPKMIGEPKIDRNTSERTYPSPLGVVEILEKRGFQIDQPSAKIRGNIHFEKYW